MLFNSYIFILLFLPITLFLYFLLHHYHQIVAAKITLIAASLLFYGYYNPNYLVILCGSILFNYFISRQLLRINSAGTKKAVMIFGIIANTLLLFYFKYAHFFF